MPMNAADQKFLEEMIPHHKEAVRMANMVIKNGQDIRVDTLAKKIRDGQAKEITQMEGWLKEIGRLPNRTEHAM